MKHTFTAGLVAFAALAFAISPFLNTEFGGFDPARYPVPQVDPPVQPAGYAFAIWGPIYLWLLGHAGFGLLRRREADDWQPMRWPLILSLAVGAIWLPVALVSPLWATVLIWVMLAGALAALLRAPDRDIWWAEAPLGLYAGWLTAASFVSLGLVLAGWGWTSEGVAAWIALLAALVLGAAILAARPAHGYGAAIAWGLIGIAAANWGARADIVALALVGGALIAALNLRGLWTRHRRRLA